MILTRFPQRESSGILLVVFLALCGYGISTANAAPENSTSPTRSESKSWFFKKVQELADSADLLNPRVVGNILEINFTASQKEEIDRPLPCDNKNATRSRLVITNVPERESWFKVTPDGVGHMKVPGFMVNRPTVTGDPQVSYRIIVTERCSGDFQVLRETMAQIGFSGVPAFACITKADVRRYLPKAEFRRATDGVDEFYYQGKIDDASGTQLRLGYRAGAECLIGATVMQEERAGYRHRRAATKFQLCAERERQQFCSNHAPFRWGDDDTLESMRRSQIEHCGTMDRFYQTEPHSGEVSEAPFRWPRFSPCG
jgi:hypothetical protein